MNLTGKWLISAVVVLALAGCSGSTEFIKKQLSGNEPELVVPHRRPIQLTDPDKLAIAGLIQKMRHKKPRGVVFDTKGSHEIVEDFDYAGFSVRNIDIAKYTIIKKDSREAIVDLGGFLHFVDKNMRATTVGFELVYKLSKKSGQPPIILKSVASNTMPSYPVVACFMIPAEAFTKGKNKKLRTFGDFLDFARRYGIDPRATDQDIALKQKQKSLSMLEKAKLTMKASDIRVQELVIMTFCFDRLNPASSLTLTVNSGEVDPVALDFDGWRVLVTAGQGKMFYPAASIRVDAYYQKDSQAMFGRTHIGRFSSLKYFPEEHGNVTHTAAKEPGPLESGRYRLDVSKHGDAVMVQTRLKELGYYTMKVDGAFGKGSRAALKAWSKDSTGKEAEYLTLAIQRQLFEGSGQ